MSWDVYIQDFGGYEKLEDIPDDFEPKSIGLKTDIIKIIKTISPNVDISDNTFLKLENDRFSIDFSLGEEEIIDSIMLHIRGDESVFGYINELISKLKMRAVDTTTGEFITVETNPEGLKIWQNFKREILKQSNNETN